jgi:hypothetical protein
MTMTTITSTSHPVTPLTSPLTRDELRNNRTFMTIVHFVLTYPRWSLSIFLLLASRSMIPLPTAGQAVREPLRDLRAVVATEAQLYKDCVLVQTQTTSTTSTESEEEDGEEEYNGHPPWNEHEHEHEHETATREWVRTQQVRAANLKVMETARDHSERCSVVDTTARRALQQVWRRQDSSSNATTNATTTTTAAVTAAVWWLAPASKTECDPTDRVNLTQILGSNGAVVVEDEVSGILAAYIATSRSSLGNVADYADSRTSYDYDYFVGYKIEAALQILDASWSAPAPTISLSFDQDRLIRKLREALQSILDALADARVRVDLLTTRIGEFQLSLQAFYQNYVDLYGRLERVALFIRDFLPAGISLPSELDLSTVPLADFLLPPIFAVPNFPGGLLDVDTLVDDFVRQVLEILAELLVELTEEASEQLVAVLQELADRLRDLLTLEDYNPPQFVGSSSSGATGDILDELDFLFNLGEAARLNTMNALQQVQEVPPIIFNQGPSLPDLDFRNTSFDGNSTAFGYLEPSFPAFSIPEFIEVFFLWVVAYQWIIEVSVQLFRLWRLKKKYEKDATPDLPTIDYGTDQDDKPHSSTLALVHVSFLKHFMTPWMALALILLPFSIATVTVWFPHVKTNCIDSRNGTFVARNIMSPLLINEANVPGNAYFTAAELQCQGNQRRICSTMFAESDALYRNDLALLFSSNVRYNQSTDTLGIFDRCIETDFLDSQFESSCCGLEGYGTECTEAGNADLCPIDNSTQPAASFRPLGEYLSDVACQSKTTDWVLQDSRFDCDALQGTCSVVASCTGVDSDLIQFLSIEADCQVETYVIKCCLLVLLALYHAIMVNLCSTLAFNGVKHLRWRSLRPDGITFRTQINEDGELVKGGDRDERSARIAIAMKRFELIGWVQIALATSLFVVWFISFFVIAASIDF